MNDFTEKTGLPQRRKGREENKASPNILDIEKLCVLGAFAVQMIFFQRNHESPIP